MGSQKPLEVCVVCPILFSVVCDSCYQHDSSLNLNDCCFYICMVTYK